MTDKTKGIAYIDKKWFYIAYCRQKVKKLPLGPHEREGADKMEMPKTRSHQLPIKSMLMGVVGQPAEQIKISMVK